MLARIEMLFASTAHEHWDAMHAMGLALTDDPDSVGVFEGVKPNWLVVQFTMPTQQHYKALPPIEWELESFPFACNDVSIGFPRTPEEQARADRKAEQARARRESRRRGRG